jgi:hypothetical protein
MRLGCAAARDCVGHGLRRQQLAAAFHASCRAAAVAIVRRSRGGRLVVMAARRTDHAPQKRLQLTQNFGRADQQDRIGPGVRVGAALGNRLRPEPVQRFESPLLCGRLLPFRRRVHRSRTLVGRSGPRPCEHRRGLVPLGSRDIWILATYDVMRHARTTSYVRHTTSC